MLSPGASASHNKKAAIVTAMITRTTTAEAIPATAPPERLDDCDCEDMIGSVAVEVAELSAAEASNLRLLLVLAVTIEAVVGIVVLREVAESPGFVDTISPRPFRTIPRFLAQHFGSLSQQKLPSVHSNARGRKPVAISNVQH